MAGMRKFFGGVVSGGLVAGLTLVVASQISVPPGTVTGGVRAVAVGTDAGQTVAPAPDQVATLPAVEVPAVEVPAPAVPAPEADQMATELVPAVPSQRPPVDETVAEAIAVAGGASEAAPVSGADPASLSVPQDLAETSVETQTETQTGSTAPARPAPSETPPALPQINAPPLAGPDSGDSVPVPAAEAAGSLVAQVPASPALPPADGAPKGAELPPPPPLTEEELASLADPARLVLPPDATADAPPPSPADDAVPTAEAVEAPTAGSPQADVTVPAAIVPSPVIDGPQTEPPTEPQPEPQTEPPTAPVAQPLPTDPPVAADTGVAVAIEAAPAVIAPDAGLAQNGPSTLPATPRLITAGAGALTDRALATDDTAPAAALPEVALEDGPALDRFASAFANADRKPLFAILLLDSGDALLDRQSVAGLPFPVSIVIDPLSPDAGVHAALYRAGGKEVIMLATGIPPGATPADVEQTFQAHDAVLPEAVAVMDADTSAFQNDRALSTQIVPILAAKGRGLVTWDRGLNAADQVARRAGLPTSTIFRQIDAEDEGVPLMRRYLDRAAFRAAQEGEAIVIGTIRPETIAAMLEWAIEGRSSAVALAPVSALLRAP
jgi:uncharacterized protein